MTTQISAENGNDTRDSVSLILLKNGFLCRGIQRQLQK